VKKTAEPAEAAVSKKKTKTVVSEKAAAPEKKKKKAKKKTKKQLLEEEKLDQIGKKWAALFRKSQKLEVKPKTYSMRNEYEAKTPIQHKVLGWGYILSNKNDRLEVLFKDGIRFLISNYKG
jgi:urease alpha subunit